MDPNQMPQAPFSPQPTPAPQPMPTAPYQAPATPQPAPMTVSQAEAIEDMTTPQADKSNFEATEAVTAAINPQIDTPQPATTPETPVMPEAPAMPDSPAPEMPQGAVDMTPDMNPVSPQPMAAQPAPEQAPTQPNPVMQPVPAQPIVNQPADPQMGQAPAPKKSNKKKILVPILAVVCIALVFGAGFLIYSLLSNTGHKGEKALLAESIFVPKDQDESSYALFSKDGKQLTEFNIDEYTNMISGYSKVRNEDGKYGIINKDGKMTVAWQDGTIESYGGLYRIASSQSGTDLLITGDAKQVDILKSDDEVVGSNYSPIAVVYHDNKVVNVYASNGDKLDEFAGSHDECETSSSSIYMAVMCKGYIGVYDIYNLKKHTSFTSQTQYDDFYANESGDTLAFKGGNSWSKDDTVRTAVSLGGQFYELGTLCDYIYVTSQTSNIDYPKGGYASCSQDGDNFLIGMDGKVTDVDVYKTAIYDANHYVKYDEDSEKAEFFVNGKSVAKVDATNTPTNYNDYYVVQKEGGATLYDLEGKAVYEASGKRAYIRGIDPYGNISVVKLDDDYNIDAYLVNKDGKELTEKYDNISSTGEYGYYMLTNSNSDRSEESKVTVVDKNGKIIIDKADCGDIYYNKYAERFYCNPSYRDDTPTARLYDKSGKELASASGQFRSADTQYHFIIEDEDGTSKYYTASGELFYTVK